jgi:hypothetical protein
MARRRGNYVTIHRDGWAYIRDRFPSPAVRGCLVDLIMEADHMTGVVEGSVRGLSKRLGYRRDTFSDYLKALAEELDHEKGVNKWDDSAGVTIVNYLFFTGQADRPSSGTGTGTVSGPVGGTIGGPETVPLHPAYAAETWPLRRQEVQEVQEGQERSKSRRAKNRASGHTKRPKPSVATSPADDPEELEAVIRDAS